MRQSRFFAFIVLFCFNIPSSLPPLRRFVPSIGKKGCLFLGVTGCIGLVVSQSLIFHIPIANYWLRLREPREVAEAISFLESQGFDVYPFFPILPISYELGISKPRWMCWKENICADLDLHGIKKSLETVSPYIMIWKEDDDFDDDKIFIIENLHDLFIIDFQHTNLSDRCIPTIAKLDSGAWVNLSGTKVTSDSIALFYDYRTSKKRLTVSIPFCRLDSDELELLKKVDEERHVHIQGAEYIER